MQFDQTQRDHLVTTLDGARQWISRAVLEEHVGFDIETRTLRPHDVIAGFSLWLPSCDQAVYIALNHPGHHLDLTPDLVEMMASLQVKTYKGDYDLSRWECIFGSCPTTIGDALIVSKMLQLHKFGLKPLAEELGIAPSTISISDILGPDCYDFTKAPLDDRTRDYGCQDARLACQVEEGLIAKHRKPAHHPGWDEVYRLELDMMIILERMTIRGMPIDKAAFEVAAAKMRAEADDLHVEICQYLGRSPDTFAIGSTKRLAAALYNHPSNAPTGSEKTQAQIECAMGGLGLTPPDKKRSTAKKIIALIADQHPVIDLILAWKSLHSVITRDLPQMVEYALTGQFHANFVQIGEDGTSRIYTEKPNLISMSYTVRRAMPPKTGCCYAHIDYSSAEWRIAALLSGETKIIDAMEAGVGAHCFTYSEMTGTPIDKVDKRQREIGKVLNYASLYGASPYRIGMTLKISQAEAAILLDDFWDAYPKLAAWIEYRKSYATKHARTYTVLGRTRKLPEVFTRNQARKRAALRQAVNTAGQGSCGDTLKLAMRRMDDAMRNGELGRKFHMEMCCPVFDAILIELDESAMDDETQAYVEQLIRDEMEVELHYEGRQTTMKVDIGWSRTNWAEACGK